ncbi:MAG: hypothetical protein AAGB51_06340 [Planctomycetota bacterium]
MNTDHRTNQSPQRAQRRLRRRGSFLIFVVATLALLSVVVVTYVGIGTTDRRFAESVVRTRVADDVPEDFANYIGQVIGNDKLDVTPVGGEIITGAGIDVLYERERTDYPSTDPDARAILRNSAIPANPYVPTGTGGTDPWLASTEPSIIGQLEGNAVLEDGDLDADAAWRLRRDWRQISNFSPSGIFVSLGNLRNNFDAIPGVEQRSGVNGLAEMSYGLTLQNMDSSSLGTYRSPLAQSGSDVPLTAGTAADPLVPAHWSSNQLGAFRPLSEPDPAFFPSSPEFFSNQWADADGDGFADSRWFEMLMPMLEPGSTTVTSQSLFVSAIPERDDLRYFFAARAIDLSGLVNATTARDLINAPSEEFPIGATPADVDLLRVLTLGDATTRYFDGPDPLSYASLIHPADTSDPADYSGVSDIGARQMALSGYSTWRADQNVDLGGTVVEFRPDPDSGFPLYDVTLGPDARYIHYDRLSGAGAASTYRDRFDIVRRRANSARGNDSLIELLTYRSVNNPVVTSPLERAIDAKYNAADMQDDSIRNYGPLRSNRPLTYERSQRIVVSAEGEPIDEALYHSFMDARQRITTLSGNRILRPVAFAPEATGRLDDRILTYNTTATIAPITEAELAFDPASILTRLDSAGARRAAVEDLFAAYADMLLPLADSTQDDWNVGTPNYRQRETLHYGHRGAEAALQAAAHMAVNMADLYDDENTSSNVSIEEPTVITLVVDKNETGDRRLSRLNDSGMSWDDVQDMTTAENLGMAWVEPAENNDGSVRPWVIDLDQLTAEGRAVGAAERLADTDTRAGTDLPSTDVVQIYGIEPQPILTEVASFTIHTDAPARPSGATDGKWGDEDSSDDASDYLAGGPGGQTYNGVTQPVTINFSVDIDNADFIAQGIAFQLTNPFEHDIPLYRPAGTGQDLPRYYLEYAGRTYAVTEIRQTFDNASDFWPDPADPANGGDESIQAVVAQTASSATDRDVLKAGESRVFYALSHDPDEIATHVGRLLDQANDAVNGILGAFGSDIDRIRFNSASTTTSSSSEAWPRFLSSQLSTDNGSGDDTDPALMPEFDAASFERIGVDPAIPVEPDLFQRAVPAQSTAYGQATNEAKDVALLWRVVLTDDEEDRVISSAPGGGFLAPIRNIRENDQLLDRLRVPSTFSLDTRTQTDPLAPMTGPSISDADGLIGLGSSDFDNDTLQEFALDLSANNNLGLTMMRWAAVMRPVSPTSEGDAVRAYMVERKVITSSLDSLNDTERDSSFYDGTPASPYTVAGDFELDSAIQDGSRGFHTLADFFEFMGGTTTGLTSTNEVFKSLRDEPPERRPSGGYGGKTLQEDDHLASERLFKPRDLYRHAFRIYPGNDRFREPVTGDVILRPADMLAALPVGPRFDPGAIADPTVPVGNGPAGGIGLLTDYGTAERIQALDRAWVTLPEAIAVGLGYSDELHGRGTYPGDSFSSTTGPLVGSTGPYGLASDPLYGAGRYMTGADANRSGDRQAMFSRAMLRPEAFVPFIDDDAGGGIREAGVMGVADEPALLTGAPLALSVFESLAPSAKYGALTEPVPGLINLNSADAEVLRSLPFFSRSGTTELGVSFRGEQPDISEDWTDIAATAVAYRDIAPVVSRENLGGSGLLSYVGEFFDAAYGPALSPTPRRDVIATPGSGDAESFPDVMRDIREEPGFKSVGELFAARRTAATSRGGSIVRDDIDRFGRDDNPGAASGSQNGFTTNELGYEFFGGDDQSRVGNDLDESLAIMNAVGNSVTVGSDLFAVWFLVHGYSREDVSGLLPEDAMSPTVRRRFLLILDRSNVTQVGDTPRIVTFQELPL